jgi:aryl-alcohol dehydrogenase-like predicted oxidoreductase
MVFTRTLGRSGIEVSGLGLGCWAIGGPFVTPDGTPVGWGKIDDAESIRAIHRALALGVTFWDTANVYGTGHSERVLGIALEGRRDEVVIATKFGRVFRDGAGQYVGTDLSPAHIRKSCEYSLVRLATDHIDLYQLHIGDAGLDQAVEIRETLEDLVKEGKIRFYAWSTDDPERARLFAQGPHCTAVQFQLNLFERSDAMLALLEEYDLAGVIRGPLAKGLLTGKFDANSKLPDNDVRRNWDFKQGAQAEQIARLDRLRAVLTQDGRSLPQAALGWLWAASDRVIPIPGFKSVQQVEDNAGALKFGPLTPQQMKDIDALLSN